MRAVWWDGGPEDGSVRMVDQRVLPHALNTIGAGTVKGVAEAIRNMTVRGAPTIGATAAYGMVLGADDPDAAARTLTAARPTARDLFAAVEHMREDPTLERAESYVEDVIDRCRRIGDHGLELLRRHAREDGAMRVLTHCHAGAFATVDIGTALAPFHRLAEAGPGDLRPSVWVDETRPRLQGAITSWELSQLGIPNRVVADGVAAHLMARQEVDMVIVGADRVARNGDVANKIGTYAVAVLAHAHGIPFYVAAPRTTLDAATASGADIMVEERDPSELLTLRGEPLFARGTEAANPAFDVTPARFVTGLVTEDGVRRGGAW